MSDVKVVSRLDTHGRLHPRPVALGQLRVPSCRRDEARLTTGYAQPSPEPRTSRVPVGVCVGLCLSRPR
eukprot:5611306-Prymnesium_polylepis.1